MQPLPETDDDGERSMFSSSTGPSSDYTLAISGDVFRWIMDYGALETVQRVSDFAVVFVMRLDVDELESDVVQERHLC